MSDTARTRRRAATPAPQHWTELVTPSYSVLLATALMLPAVGALVRFVAFATAGLPDATRLASTLPLPELAATGFLPVTTVVFILAVARLAGAMRSRIPFMRPKGDPARETNRLVVLIAVAAGTLMLFLGYSRFSRSPPWHIGSAFGSRSLRSAAQGLR